MSSRLDALAGRRAALVARSDRERAALAATFGGIERRSAVAEVIFSAVRGVRRRRGLHLAGAILMILAPRAARTFLRRAVWILPLAVAGYRVVKALRGARPTSSPD